MFYRNKNENNGTDTRLYQAVQFGYPTCIIRGGQIHHLGSTDLILVSTDESRDTHVCYPRGNGELVSSQSARVFVKDE